MCTSTVLATSDSGRTRGMVFKGSVEVVHRTSARRRAAGLCCMLLLLACVCLVRGANAASKRQTESSQFFGLTNLWSIHLLLSSDQWAAMERVPPKRPGGPEQNPPWSLCTVECQGQSLTNVAIRLKGNSSLAITAGSWKRPFKIDFNRGAKGRSFHGAKELSLNNNVNDATQFREVLAYQACQLAGLPTPRTAFAQVHLTVSGRTTNQLLGLYTLVEPVDEDFLEARFASKDGLLLKPERMGSLDYLGDDWAAYTARYQPKSAVRPAEAGRLIELSRLAAQADDETFARELPGRLDLTNFLRYVAVMAILANYDSFIGNGHNYYLFQPSQSGKALFIPWDLNEAFGGHPRAGQRQAQAELSVLHPHGGNNRLIERVLANPKWAAEYRQQVQWTLSNACSTARLTATAQELARVVQPIVFAESLSAKTSFQRVALGQADAVAPPPGPGERRQGPGIPAEQLSLADWIGLRSKNVAGELAGKRQGKPLSMPSGPPPRTRPPGR